MRVLHVMEATIGGTRRHLVDVARGQLQRGLDVHLAVATQRDPDFPADLEALEREGAQIVRLPMCREVRPTRDAADYRSLVRELRARRPALVHTHSSKAGVLGRAASLRTGIGARVHTPHAFAFLFEALFGPLRRDLYRRVERWLAARTDRVVAVSPSEARTFEASGVVPRERIRMVPNGIDPAPFTDAEPADLATLGLDPRRVTLVVVGLVYPAKGQDLALRALAGPGCEELQLVVVGPGELGELEQLAKSLGLSERVRCTGPRRDVPAWLAAADALLLPSRWEGLPYVVLEAMAAGLPVVSTPVDGARDLVEDGATGFLAREVTAEALRVAILRWAATDTRERGRMAAAARERVASRYTIERMVEGLLDVYRELV